MRRREFLGVLSSAAVWWPFAAGAQQPMPVVGFLNTQPPEDLCSFRGSIPRGLG